MPRPKRTKISHPVPVKHSANAHHETPAEARLKSKSSNFDLYDVSDELEGSVMSVRRVKRGNGSALEGKPAKTRQGSLKRKAIGEHELSEVDGDAAVEQSHGVTLGDLEFDESSIETEVGRRDTTATRVENSVLNIGNFRRRPRQPSILGRGNDRASSVESNLAETNGLSTLGRRGRIGLERQRSQARDASVESGDEASKSSSPALGRNTPARVDSALRLSSFRRRERQPSILGTAQKDQQSRPAYEVDEEDFNPDDVSTPLKISKTKARTSLAPQLSNQPQHRTTPSQGPESSPAAVSEDEQLPERPLVTLGDPEDSEDADKDLALPSTERSPTLNLLSETLAPPRSSPSLPSPRNLHQADSRATTRNARIPHALSGHSSSSLPSSPPSLTHSPNYPTRGRGRSRSKAPPSAFSTAELTALLPRRRRTRAPTHDPFAILPSSDEEEEEEIDATGLGEDEDELSHLDAQARVRTKSRRNRPAAVAKAKAKSKPGPSLKPKSSAPAKEMSRGKGAKRTYGSISTFTAITSDKENEDVDDVDPNDSLAPLPDTIEEEDSQVLEKRVGKELKMAKRKFEVVDKWELDFEVETGSSSSPTYKDAR